MHTGRPFLQIPGPTNVPDRILQAMHRPVIDHRSPQFASLTKELLPKLQEVFGTRDGAIVLYPASGTGAREASLVNVLAPGDRVLAFNYGHFSAGFAEAARRLGFGVDEVPLEWGQAPMAAEVEARLRADVGPRRYRAVLAVHNETSTGVLSDIGALRAAIDAADHDALLITDSISAFASVPMRFDDWGVDVCVAASQKGLMMPPGLAILCASSRALAVAENGGSPRGYFDWRPVLRDNQTGFFPYTPPTNLLFGLREALRMLVDEEGLRAVYARHRRLSAGVRVAVQAWGMSILCQDLACASPTLTAVVLGGGLESADVVNHARSQFGLSLGMGLGQMKGKTFRIGHLGSLNELEVLATLAGIEMTYAELGMPVLIGTGVGACQRHFVAQNAEDQPGSAALGPPAN